MPLIPLRSGGHVRLVNTDHIVYALQAPAPVTVPQTVMMTEVHMDTGRSFRVDQSLDEILALQRLVTTHQMSIDMVRGPREQPPHA